MSSSDVRLRANIRRLRDLYQKVEQRIDATPRKGISEGHKIDLLLLKLLSANVWKILEGFLIEADKPAPETRKILNQLFDDCEAALDAYLKERGAPGLNAHMGKTDEDESSDG